MPLSLELAHLSGMSPRHKVLEPHTHAPFSTYTNPLRMNEDDTVNTDIQSPQLESVKTVQANAAPSLMWVNRLRFQSTPTPPATCLLACKRALWAALMAFSSVMGFSAPAWAESEGFTHTPPPIRALVLPDVPPFTIELKQNIQTLWVPPLTPEPLPTQLSVLLEDPPTEEERREIYTQIAACQHNTVRSADPWLVLALWRLEGILGVPDEARGILGATWCIESAFRSDTRSGSPIRGDFRQGHAYAHGPFQLWPWFRTWCGLSDGGADDLLAAATCYWARIQDRYEVRVRDLRCKEPWKVAEAFTANGPRYVSEGCRAESKHWKEMKQWRKPKVRVALH